MTKTAAEYRAEAAAAEASREESFRRCDTDGFLSQWASGKTAELARAKAKLAEEGWTAEFPGLYRRDTGERVRAKLISFKCRYTYRTKWSWSFRHEDGSVDRSKGLLPDTRTKRGKLWKSGYEVRMERAPANAAMEGEGTGLSGTCWVAVFRTDDGYPADAVGASDGGE
jgi:hypothetical protein